MTELNVDSSRVVAEGERQEVGRPADKQGHGGHGGHGKKPRIKRGKFRRFAPHVLLLATTLATLRTVFTNVEDSLTPLQLHIVLGVLGYQVLMGQGTLIISTMAHKDARVFPNTDKKTLHWVTQAAGAACALACSVVIYRTKEEHLNSIHGVLGMLALLLTAISSLNGVVFWFWKELGITKGNIKFFHTLTGALTFVLATLCLCYGYNKKTFHRWTSAPFAYSLMVIAVASIVFFCLSPGRIILNWFRPRQDDDKREGKEKAASGEGRGIQLEEAPSKELKKTD